MFWLVDVLSGLAMKCRFCTTYRNAYVLLRIHEHYENIVVRQGFLQYIFLILNVYSSKLLRLINFEKHS